MSRNVLLVLGVLLIGAAAWLVDAMQLSPRAALGLEGQRIEALLAARVAFERSVLEARAGLQSSFDPINHALTRLRDAADAARALQASGEDHAPAAARVALAARALESEEAALEQLKTDLALLRLSSHHFPPAADALIRRAEAEGRRDRRSLLSRELSTLAALRTDVARFEELPARDGMQRLDHGLSRLQTLRASLDDASRAALDVVSGHTRAILDRRERVDDFVRLLVHSPVREHLEAARAAYERGARQRAQRVGALQVLSGVLALAGVAVLLTPVLSGARRRAR